MYTYNHPKVLAYIGNLLKSHISPEAWLWLNEQADKFNKDNGRQALFLSFTAAPRQTGKKQIPALEAFEEIPGFSLENCTADRLARMWILLKWPTDNKSNYTGSISQLFKAAEMNELVALYGSLPLLAYAEEWVAQCREGIRSNIGSVLEAIMCNNPYPAQHLDEQGWNQMIMKAFFTEKPVNEIIGLDERVNSALAETLSDYVHERWAAHRTANAQIWRLIIPFINADYFEDLRKMFLEGNGTEKEAAALALYQSKYEPAKELLATCPSLIKAIENNQLNWSYLAKAI